MFDITAYEFENEIDTIRNLNSIQRDEVLKILSKVKEKLTGFNFEAKCLDLEENVNQFGRKKINYLEYEPDEQRWFRKFYRRKRGASARSRRRAPL
jgi:hypothetical protein